MPRPVSSVVLYLVPAKTVIFRSDTIYFIPQFHFLLYPLRLRYRVSLLYDPGTCHPACNDQLNTFSLFLHETRRISHGKEIIIERVHLERIRYPKEKVDLW